MGKVAKHQNLTEAEASDMACFIALLNGQRQYAA
jgi:hypothetical protein